MIPDLPGGAAQNVRVVSVLERPTCSLYRLDGYGTGEVMLKVRRVREQGRAGADAGRPELGPPVALSAEEAARNEYEGLSLIDESLRQDAQAADDRFLRVRPLFVSHTALGMDYLSLPTLKRELAATLSRRRRPSSGLLTALGRAGEGLRRYHDAAAARHLAPVAAPLCAGSEVLVALLPAFAGYLARHGLPGRQERLLRQAPGFLEPALPATFACVPRHGDFSPRNVLVDPANRIAILDPMPAWTVPPGHDLATFLHGIRMPALQVASQGLAFRPAALARSEDAFLAGYFGDEPVPPVELAAFRLLVLLDHWAGTVSVAAAAGRRPDAVLKSAWWSRYYRHELDRQLDDLRALV